MLSKVKKTNRLNVESNFCSQQKSKKQTPLKAIPKSLEARFMSCISLYTKKIHELEDLAIEL